jgi:hypothetical protein
MNIQNELQKIHHQYGTTEIANYHIQKLFDKGIKEAISDKPIKHFYSGITLETDLGKQLHVALRDWGFEMRIDNGKWHLITIEDDFCNKKMVEALKTAKKTWEELAHATGETGLLNEDVAYQAIINAIPKEPKRVEDLNNLFKELEEQ